MKSKTNPLFLLLDLVDRYWNGSKSLHKNFKFIGAANQLLSQYKLYSGEHNVNEDQINSIQSQFRMVQDENKRLQQQLIAIKSNCKQGENESSSELHVKNLLQEIVNYFTKSKKFDKFINFVFKGHFEKKVNKFSGRK